MFKVHQCNTKNSFPFNLFAEAVKFFQNVDYSHYSFEIDDRMYDASPHAVRGQSVNDYCSRYDIFKSFDIDIEIDEEKFKEWFSHYEGRKYGYLQALGLGVKTLGLTRKNIFSNGSDAFICNELVVRFLDCFTSIEVDRIDGISMSGAEEVIREAQSEGY